MLESIDSRGRKLVSDIIYFTIKHDEISEKMISDEFNVSHTVASAAVDFMITAGILAQRAEKGQVNYFVAACEASELHPEVIDLLLKNGYKEGMISKAFDGLEVKTETSNILSDRTHSWKPISDKPEMNKQVLIRIMDPTKTYMESRSEIIYAEDLKIATWDGFEWIILPPYPKYDFSPNSNHGKINETAVVTHWAEVTDQMISDWEHRFDPIGKYKKLIIAADDESEESVYRSLILAAACIMKEANRYPDDNPMKKKLTQAHAVMCDLQSVIDKGELLSNMEGDS